MKAGELAGPRKPGHDGVRPHVIYLAIGFPPAAKSSAYRLRETANQFIAHGWDVTVITISNESWEREFGLDHTLSARVDPRIRIVELPIAREDLETDIRRFSRQRALEPQRWLSALRRRQQESFPESVFGGWRDALEEGVLRVHREHPADLLMTSCAPYVNLAPTWRLWTEHRVPYVVDFRDGWSINVIDGTEAFERDSVAGKWEQQVLEQARAVWCVNDPIADFYRERYPSIADRVRVARNGFDADSVPAPSTRTADPEQGLVFGYLGTVNFPPSVLDAVLTGWRLAREQDPLLARSRLEVRGHIGAGEQRGVNPYIELLEAAQPDGVTFGGNVAKADVAGTYGSWDALVLMLVGGRYVTSGKVYEFVATGLPIVSAHEIEHDAATVLDGYPLWTGAVGLNPRRLAESFVTAARLAVEAPAEVRQAAREHAGRFTRPAQIAPVVAELSSPVPAQRPDGSAALGPAEVLN
ncbi:glycosyltransferase family protein [Catellatospora vulcania]|uniref:glycosyltransferase n=1 Tax=Catellatospora vulcania TaxID=1460450 RepID=UPI001E3C0034|nr:glycosyltransferase [Catellatospora vulcania]